MNKTPKAYLQYWSSIFNLPCKDLANPDFTIATDGYYVERHLDKYIFLYLDLNTHKKILGCSHNNLRKIRTWLYLSKFKLASLTEMKDKNYFENMPLTFNDVDYGILNPAAFKPVATEGFDIRPLQENQILEIESFYLDCSEDEIDTLDLRFENEVVLGMYIENQLSGIARYTPIRNTSVADITVLIRKKARGKGFSTPLTSRLIEIMLENKLQPKYRVEESNAASTAIAKRLGFRPFFHILTWEIKSA